MGEMCGNKCGYCTAKEEMNGSIPTFDEPINGILLLLTFLRDWGGFKLKSK